MKDEIKFLYIKKVNQTQIYIAYIYNVPNVGVIYGKPLRKAYIINIIKILLYMMGEYRNISWNYILCIICTNCVKFYKYYNLKASHCRHVL
jgi:hypothetical protein